MIRKTLTCCLAALALNYGSSAEAKKLDWLDDIVENIYLDEKGSEWRDHLWLSTFLTLTDSFLLKHAGCDDKKANELSVKTRFLETVGYEGLYTPIFERKITPTYALFDLAGLNLGYYLFPKLKPLQPFVDKIADITNKQTLENIAVISASLTAISYTLPRQRDLIKFDADEQIDDNNFFKHVGFFSYYTLRTSLLLENTGYKKHPPESLAWRVAFGLGLVKELIIDGTIGKGPSILDVGADSGGVFLGYMCAKTYRNLIVLPYRNGARLFYNF